ncbi:MAG: hypothetical protein LBM02_10220 [Lachnospiraceae bacterium]|jgi:DNA-binding MarR family transcriptional regulator|nr:hypothetical protein [Lachnospiraceae bacterium]
MLIENFEITPGIMGLLVFIQMNKSTNPNEYILNMIRKYGFELKSDNGKSTVDVFEEKGWITYIKSGKKEPWYRIRLTKDGEAIIKSIWDRPVHPLAKFTLDYTYSEYIRIGADDLAQKSGEKLLLYISDWLYYKENYNERMIKAVITSYVDKNADNKKYMNKMKTLFFKPVNLFEKNWKSEDSPICLYIDNNKNNIKETYRRILK